MVGGRPVGYIHSGTEDLNSGRPRTNPAGGKVESVNPEAPEFDTSTLNQSATLLP